MSEFRFILGRRVLILFLALLVVTGAFFGVPAATQILAESPPPGSQEASAASDDSVAADGSILDPSSHSPLLQGGSSTGTWTKTNTVAGATTPTARYHHAMAATPSGVLLFGGSPDNGHTYFGDTWLFKTTTGTWGLLTNTIPAPSKRYYHAMAATPSGDVLLFGGTNGTYLNDTWLFNTTSSTWGLLDTGSTSPSARAYYAMATTPSGVLLFGGTGGGTRNDTWLFTNTGTGTGTWTDITAGTITSTNTPTARQCHAMATTPSGDVLLFGGTTGSVLGDTWLFNTANKTWSQPTITGSIPSARANHAMASTPSGVLLFGGWDGSYSGETWLFTYNGTGTGTWGLLDTGSASPPARSDHAMAYDSHSGKTLLFGGYAVGSYFADTWLYGPIILAPTIAVTSPTASAHWPIGSSRDITWTSTDLNSNTLTILLARDGVNFTETLTTGVDAGSTFWTWTVSGPGTINAKIRVQQEATEGASPGFFTIADAYPYNGTPTTTLDPVLDISGGSGTGTIWVTPLDPQYTSDPDLSQFIEETGKRSALFFDIYQQGLTGTLTIVLHFNHQLGEETFQLYLWDGAGWVNVPGIPPSPNLADHTFTITINASLLSGTPFALGGNPAAMPGMSPWALALLCLALLGAGGWWFSRRRGLA